MNDLRHSFPGQQTDEPVFIFARSYPIAFIPTALIFLFVYLFSVISQFALRSNTLVQFDSEVVNIGIATLGVFQLLTIIVFFVAVFDFYFDIIIVTDRRLVDIDQEQILFRRISELTLEDVEDVSSQVSGLFPTIFDYGKIEVQTSGTKENFIMHNIHKPREVTSVILNLKDHIGADASSPKRSPQDGVIAVINNKTIKDFGELERIGAMAPGQSTLNKIQ